MWDRCMMREFSFGGKDLGGGLESKIQMLEMYSPKKAGGPTEDSISG